MNRLIIVGSGSHGKVILDIALKLGYENIAFLDDHAEKSVLGFDIIGKIADLEELDDAKTDFIIGIGNNHTRKKIQESYNVNWVSLVHQSAQIGYKASIGKGSVVMAGAVICTCAEIGAGCIVNTCASVDHECKLEDFVHVSAGVRVAGNVTIGDSTFVGIGATISNNIEITSNCLIGAGAVVVKTIKEAGTYIGVPARKLIK